MRIDLGKVLKFLLINITIFYGIKWYYDGRQVRMVSALLPSVVKIGPIGDQYRYDLIPTENGFMLKKKRVGFGVNGHGSGIFINKNGLILTCAHVVEGTPLTMVVINSSQTVKAYVLGRDIERDVALLKLVKPIKGIRPVSLGKSAKKGLSVLTIGFPGPFNKYVTQGIISGSLNGHTFSDVVVAPGNSGGGVFNQDSRLVGLAKGMTGPVNIPTYQGFTLLTTLDSIKEIIRKYNGF